MQESYNIREHLDVLIPAKGSKTKYHCPVCNGDDLDINQQGAYNCFSGNCEPKDIRYAIDLLEGKPEWKPDKFVKPIRPKSQKDYFYPDRQGNPLVKVRRSDDGNGKKSFYQSHWDGTKWIKGNPDRVKNQIPIYRYAEVQQEIERDRLIFWVEGESTADALWDLGIPATTTIGGSGGYSTYGDYQQDLTRARLLLAPDRDSNGLKYIANIERDFLDQIEGYYLAGTVGLWKQPAGGMDIGDDIGDRQLNLEQILNKVISPSDYQSITSSLDANESEVEKSTYFTSSIESGLVQIVSSGDKESSESIGNHLEVTAYVNNPDKDGASLILEFKTIHGQIRRWTMTRADLAGDGTAIVAGLLSRDYAFARKQKNLLLDYIHGLGSEVENTYTVTDSSGWVEKSFVLPHKTYGDENLKFRDVDPSPDAITELKGTLQGWLDNVASRCAGNSRLILALGNSFAAPLLPIVEIESGGFHLVGETSQGKTTILSVAASVIGVKDIPHWRTTTNGLESIATAFNHLCLPLDEIGQADPKDVGNIAYMLANGQGKARMTKNLTNRKPKIWQLMVLSSGEVGLGSYMAQANITQKGGQEVRLPDVPAVPTGSIYGCFETIHGADTAVQFVSALEAAVKDHHGTALDAFLSRLVTDVALPQFVGNLSKQVHLIAAKLSEGTIDSAVGRVAKRFALVQVSLGLAHKYGLLPFSIDQVDWAISTIFKDWLLRRGGDGSIEVKQAIDRIEHLLVTNEFSDRVFNLGDGDTKTIRNLLAYRKVGLEGDTEELWIPPSVFDKEFCNGVNKAELVKELQRIGWLLPPSGDKRPTFERRVNGKKSRYFIFQSWERVFGMETVETVETVLETVSQPGFENNFTVSIDKNPMETVETADLKTHKQVRKTHNLSPLSPCPILPLETDGDIQTSSLEQVSSSVSTVSTVSMPKTRLGKFISKNDLNVGDRVKIPNCGKYGVIERIAPKQGRRGLFARIVLDGGVNTVVVELSAVEVCTRSNSAS